MRRYSAELLGAFFVVFTFLSASSRSNPDLAALAVSAVLVASVWGAAHISGAHFNPAVSFGVFLRGGMSALDLVRYWASQLAGALLAAVLALWLFPVSGLATGISRGLSTSAGLVAALAVEFAFTFALVWVVLTIGASRKQERNVRYGLAVGLVVLVGTLVVADISGAAFNPAVAFGMSVDGKVGWGSTAVYLLAELTGGGAAAVLVARTATL